MRGLVIPIVTTVLMVGAMLYQAREIDPVLCEPPAVRLGEIAGFESEPVEVSEAELTVLPADTKFDKRAYRDEYGRQFHVSVVIGGRSKSSVHRPELCLPAQGFLMTDPRTATVGDVDWHFVTLARRDAPSMGFAYTFFNQAGYRTSSHVKRIFRDVVDRSILGRIDRWVMGTVYASTADERTLRDFLTKLKEVIK